MSGAPVTSQRFEENRNKFRDYVFARSAHNYKFWIVSSLHLPPVGFLGWGDSFRSVTCGTPGMEGLTCDTTSYSVPHSLL